MKKLLRTHALTVGLIMAAGSAFANDVEFKTDSPILGTVTDDADQFITLTSENDKYFGHTDRHYTNGAQIQYTSIHEKPVGWVQWIADNLPFLDINGPIATNYSLGQQIYTPDHAERPYAQPGDMPFTGFLYGKVGFTTYGPTLSDSYELTAGTIGPSGQGEFVQKTYHDALGFYKPRGWDYYQLHDEPILNFSFVRRHTGILSYETTALGNDWFVDATPHYGFAAGNQYDFANAGGVVRFGPASARHMDVPGLTVPGLPGGAYFSKGDNWFDWYLFAGMDGRAVARDIYLDGNTFKDSFHVEKKVFVGNAMAGATMVTGKVKTSFTLNQESNMYKGQPDTDVYGAINVGYRF